MLCATHLLEEAIEVDVVLGNAASVTEDHVLLEHGQTIGLREPAREVGIRVGYNSHSRHGAADYSATS